MADAVWVGVADSDGDGKLDTLELVGLWSMFGDRLRVGVAVPVVGVNFASRAGV